MAASPKNSNLAGSSEAAERRKRYERSSAAAPIALTPIKWRLLQLVFESRVLSLPQVAALMDCSEQSARRHMRELYDARLLERIALTRAELADPAEPNDASLLHGSAPNIHAVSRKGVEQLVAAGLLDKDALRRPIPSYGPQNSLFLRHELLVRDVRVWLEKVVRAEPQRYELMSWIDGDDAAITTSTSGTSAARPDARFVLKVGEKHNGQSLVLSAMVEVDRGTERGMTRWEHKLACYSALFAKPAVLKSVTGYQNARVLILATTNVRATKLLNVVELIIQKSGILNEFAERFWIADTAVLNSADFCQHEWSVPWLEGTRTLI